MSFGETLYTLRKGKNMSQERLAQELNTSRQAVSKWENNQGFPEMDKLKIISNLFGVSIDYLLGGGHTDQEGKQELGYYASGETIEGFLVYKCSMIKSAVTGIFLILLSGAPYLLFPKSAVLPIVLAAFLLIAGAGSILAACFRENRYQKITEESLILDNAYLTELQNRYAVMKKKYAALFIAGMGLGFASLVLTTLLEDVFRSDVTGYHTVALLMLAVGSVMIIYSSGMMSTFDVVINNDKYMKKKKAHRAPFTFWQVICMIILCVAALAFVYMMTGGDGRIAHYIDKIISKL